MLVTRLSGLTVAVDIQHAYRDSHRGDEGAVFTSATGAHVTEVHISTIYAIALVDWFRSRGARVITNDRRAGTLLGEYWTRNQYAASNGACAYLACHVNAGGGRHAVVEYMNGSPGRALSLAILPMLQAWAPDELRGAVGKSLAKGDRGAVCVQSFPGDRGAAVILEPFFGDCPDHLPLWESPRLSRLAGAIGEGVARWWASTYLKPSPPQA